MNSNIIVKEFNNKTVEFLKQALILCERMDNNAVKAVDIVNIEMLNSVEPDFILKLYIKHMMKYKDKIDNYDHSFLDKFDIKSINFGDLRLTVISKYLTFMKLFKKLNADNKRILFDYLQLFCGLSLKYAEINILKVSNQSI